MVSKLSNTSLTFLENIEDQRFVVVTTPDQKRLARSVCQAIFDATFDDAAPDLIKRCTISSPELTTVLDMVRKYGFFIVASDEDCDASLRAHHPVLDTMLGQVKQQATA